MIGWHVWHVVACNGMLCIIVAFCVLFCDISEYFWIFLSSYHADMPLILSHPLTEVDIGSEFSKPICRLGDAVHSACAQHC